MINTTETKETTIVTGTQGAQHVADGPLTTGMADAAAPGLLLSETEQRITRVKPMSTPIDQITRLAGARPAKSMEVQYYMVDTKPTWSRAMSMEAIEGEKYAGAQVYRLKTVKDDIFAPTETILVTKPGSGDPIAMLYVTDRVKSAAGTELHVIMVNPAKNTPMPPAANSDTLVRMGRAAGELDVQTGQFQAMPKRRSNFCQIFKAQIEQSAVVSHTDKEVGWSMEDQEESAVTDMRLGMERSFLFGIKAKINNDATGEETLFTGGIWTQAAGTFELPKAPTQSHLTSMMRAAFTGNAAGSTRKILLAGSGLMERLSNLDAQKVIGAADKVTAWGLEFHRIYSNFGTLLVVHSEVFDQCDRADDGMIIDPAYMTKYSFEPFRAERLDLRGSGQRNCEAVVMTEASCVVLRHPTAHLKITMEAE